MLCKVCSKEIISPKLETIGNQVVCCLSCVGLLVSNEEDKCDNCQRPVWKDNYYIFNSKNYCSEKCKLTVVKRFLKQNSSLTGVNIKHVQNEFFKNDSPTKNLQELRKEVKELYKDFEFEENCSTNNIQNSLEKKSLLNLETVKSIRKSKELNEEYNIQENPEINKNIENNSNPYDESVNKFNYNLIPNKIASIRINSKENHMNDNDGEYKYPRLLSRKKILESYRRVRNNYSFDNQDQMLYNENNDMNDFPRLKIPYNNNRSICNVNKSFKNNMKLKPTILRLQNKDKKIRNKLIVRIPNPHMSKFNENHNSRFERYNDSFINNENENYENIHNRNNTNYNADFKQFNTTAYNNWGKKIYSSSHSLSRNNKINDTSVYLHEPNYKIVDNSNF